MKFGNVKNLKIILNCGTDKVRFISPVLCNNNIRAIINVVDAKDYKEVLLNSLLITIEIMNHKKPTLVASTLSLFYTNNSHDVIKCF